MHIERNCKHCGKNFFAQKKKQLFCSRRCFKQDYYELKRQEALLNFPNYKCPKCSMMTKLNFDPSKHLREWNNFKCPWCYYKGVTIEVIIETTTIFVIF